MSKKKAKKNIFMFVNMLKTSVGNVPRHFGASDLCTFVITKGLNE